jgi:YesN/AraC family two-component response regulator
MNQTPKILYVDDEPINLQLFEINFRKKYRIITAENGPEGLEKLEENPDTVIIISDMRMPYMSGLEFIIKAKEKYPDKKFYILSGFEITPEIRAALDSGLILKYFNKPFNIEEIDASIVEIIS